MEKVRFKGSAMLNPVPVALITTKNNEKTNVFTVGWIGTATQAQIPYQMNLGITYE